jgi:predicted DNA-binding transcriptional regulator AlpA
MNATQRRLVTAPVVAHALGVSRSYVYANAAKLGGYRGPAGPDGKAPVRFDLDQALAAFSRLEEPAPMPEPVLRAPRRSPITVELLPIGGAR